MDWTHARERFAFLAEALDGGGKSDLVLTHFLAQMTDQESATLRTALQRLAGTEGQE